MSVLLAIALFSLALIIHEAGHFMVMRRSGMEIIEAGIGFNIPHVPKLKFRSQRFFPEVTFVVSLLLFGAYVKPSEAAWLHYMTHLNRKEKAYVIGAGILANLVMAALLYCVVVVLYHAELWKIPVALTLAVVLLIWRREFCAYAIPVLSIGVLAWLVKLIIWSPAGAVGGPVMIVSTIAKIGSLSTAILFGYMLSLSLGIFNMLPLGFLDGGKVWEELLAKSFPKSVEWYRGLSTLMTLILLVYVMTADVLRLF